MYLSWFHANITTFEVLAKPSVLPGSGLSARVFELRRRDARAPMSRLCKNLL